MSAAGPGDAATLETAPLQAPPRAQPSQAVQWRPAAVSPSRHRPVSPPPLPVRASLAAAGGRATTPPRLDVRRREDAQRRDLRRSPPPLPDRQPGATSDEFGPLPPGWKTKMEGGRRFYYIREKDVTSWHRPKVDGSLAADDYCQNAKMLQHSRPEREGEAEAEQRLPLDFVDEAPSAGPDCQEICCGAIWLVLLASCIAIVVLLLRYMYLEWTWWQWLIAVAAVCVVAPCCWFYFAVCTDCCGRRRLFA